MFALAHSRIDVRRDRVGLREEGLRGVNAVPGNVDEALGRLRELEAKTAAFVARRRAEVEVLKVKRGKGEEGPKTEKEEQKEENGGGDGGTDGDYAGGGFPPDGEMLKKDGPESRQARLKSIAAAAKGRKLFKEGRLVHRTEPEIRTHTSYLVFAVLPREWTEEDEVRCVQGNQ
jgi:tRNA (adenine57-N1/adenine58-N1)-methyltransferase